MTKHFCDRCKEECSPRHGLNLNVYERKENERCFLYYFDVSTKADLCDRCLGEMLTLGIEEWKTAKRIERWQLPKDLVVEINAESLNNLNVISEMLNVPQDLRKEFEFKYHNDPLTHRLVDTLLPQLRMKKPIAEARAVA